MRGLSKSRPQLGPFPALRSAFMPPPMSATPLVVPVGASPARAFGMEARQRACSLASNAGFECGDAVQPGRPALLASMAYAWDPAWLKAVAARPRNVLTLGGKPVIAHLPADSDAAATLAALDSGLVPPG